MTLAFGETRRIAKREAQKRLDAHMAAHGYTEKVWHGANGPDFNVFTFSADSHDVPAAYFTYRRETAQNYAAIRGMDGTMDGDYSKLNTRGPCASDLNFAPVRRIMSFHFSTNPK